MLVRKNPQSLLIFAHTYLPIRHWRVLIAPPLYPMVLPLPSPSNLKLTSWTSFSHPALTLLLSSAHMDPPPLLALSPIILRSFQLRLPCFWKRSSHTLLPVLTLYLPGCWDHSLMWPHLPLPLSSTSPSDLANYPKIGNLATLFLSPRGPTRLKFNSTDQSPCCPSSARLWSVMFNPCYWSTLTPCVSCQTVNLASDLVAAHLLPF